MKSKLTEFISKRYQIIALVLFLALTVGAFFALSSISQTNKNNNDDDIVVNTDDDDDGEDGRQDGDDDDDKEDNDKDDETVVIPKFMMPISEMAASVVVRPYYDMEANTQEQEQSVIYYNNSYYLNNGINIGISSGETFDVLSAYNGTVTEVEQTSLHNYRVVIDHGNDIKTIYTSLASVDVEVGNVVLQSDVLGKAGVSEFDLESAVHVHFSVMKNGNYMNPNDVVGKKMSEL